MRRLLLGLTQNQVAWVFYLYSDHGYSPNYLWKPHASASSAAFIHLWQRCPDLMDRYEAWQLLSSVSAHSAPHPLISLFCLWFPPDWLSVDETCNEMVELHGNTSAFWLSSGGLSEPGDIVEISPWIWKQKQIAGNISSDISFSKISFSLSNWENVAWIVTVDLFQIDIFSFLSSRNLNYRLGIRSHTNLWGNLTALRTGNAGAGFNSSSSDFLLYAFGKRWESCSGLPMWYWNFPSEKKQSFLIAALVSNMHPSPAIHSYSCALHNSSALLGHNGFLDLGDFQVFCKNIWNQITLEISFLFSIPDFSV